MAEQTALITVEHIDPVALFTGGKIDAILGEIKAKATALMPDTSTANGRKEIASMANRVARSKTLLDGIGKEMVSGWKAKTKIVDAERKKLRDFCDDLKAEVRAPLTAWEEAEAERASRLSGLVNRIMSLSSPVDQAGNQLTAEELSRRLDELGSVVIDSSWGEFEDMARDALAASLSAVETALGRRKQYEADQAELERLRKAEAERAAKEAAERAEAARKERDERIAREAAERAIAEAARKAEAKRIETERKIATLKAEAERAERLRIEAAERAKAEQESAVRAAEEKARWEAAEREIARIEGERKAKEREKRLAANKAHWKKITSEISDAICAQCGVPSATAESIVAAIASGTIPNLRIVF